MRPAAPALLLALALALTQGPAQAYDPARHPAPNPQGGAYDQGRLKLQAGEWQGAAALFRRAVEENRMDHRAWTLLGYSLRQQGRHREALAAYDQALRINPLYAEALEYRGLAHAALGDLDLARRDLERLARLGSPLAEDLRRAIEAPVRRD
jgi:tetratricopeptide (TPR) repeat protein